MVQRVVELKEKPENFRAEAFWGFAFLICLSSPLFALGLHFFPKASFFLAGKDILILCTLPILLIWGKWSRNLWSYLLFLPFVIYSGISFISSDCALTAKAGSFRQLFMPFLFLVLGSLWGLTSPGLEAAKNLFKHWIWVFLTFGFWFYLFPKPFLNFADIYFQYKNINFNEWGYPGQWIEPVFGGIPRMASTFFDPVNWGHFLAFALFYFFPKPWSKSDRLVIFLLLVCLMGSFCKGAWLQLFLVILWAFSPFPLWIRISGYLGLPIFLFFASFFHPGVANHLLGLSNALKSISVFGYGIGSTGNVALLLNVKIEPFIFDTYLGAVLGQLGLLGAFFWLFAWFGFLLLFYRKNKVLATILLAQVFVSFYSENAFNFLSVFPICFFAGAEWAASRYSAPSVAVVDPVGIKAGMDYFSSHLAEALRKAGFNVYIFSNMEKGPFQEKCFYAGFLPGWKKPFFLMRGYFQTFACLWKYGCNQVILHGFKTTFTEAIVYTIMAILNVRIHLIVHDVESFDNRESKWLKRFLLSYLPQQIYCLNQFSRSLLEDQLRIKRQVQIIPHGHYLDLPLPNITRDKAREMLKLEKEEFYFLFFGQIKPVKGLDVLLEAMKKLKNGKLLVAGQPRGVAMDDIKSQTTGLPDRILLNLGYISNQDRELYFKACNVVVVPYRKIYQSGVLLMALSYQKPVIASNLPPNLELMNAENGWIFESENATDLAEKMEEAYSSSGEMEKKEAGSLTMLEKNYSWMHAAEKMNYFLRNPA